LNDEGNYSGFANPFVLKNTFGSVSMVTPGMYHVATHAADKSNESDRLFIAL